jgi:hypothetical protein
MNALKTELTWATGPDAMKVRMRELAREGTWEAFLSILALRQEIPAAEVDCWRDAADDCLERYLTTCPDRTGSG